MSLVLFDVPGPKAARRHRIIGALTVVGLIAIVTAVVWKLWTEDQFTAAKWEPFVTPSIIELLVDGLIATLKAAFIAIIFAFVVGVLFGVGKMSDHRLVRWPAWLVVEFFRAVPLLMLIIFIWALQGYPLGTITPLVLGLILYNGSVIAEIVRAGVNAVPKGQAEAAYSIGMRKSQVMRIIQLPQAIKIMLPSLISQFIVVLKDTSLGFVILAPGLTFSGREIYRTFDNRLATALVLAAIYVIINLLLTYLATALQRRFGGESRIDLVGDIVQSRPGADAGAAVGPEH